MAMKPNKVIAFFINIALLLIPYAIILFLVLTCVSKFHLSEINKIGLIAIFSLLAVAFSLTLIIVGFFKKSFKTVAFRLKELFNDLTSGFGFTRSFSYYFHDILKNGIAFWIYLLIIISYLLLCILTIKRYFVILNG